MKFLRAVQFLSTFILSASLINHFGFAAEAKPSRPYFCLFATSIDRVVDSFEEVFDSVGRHDLSVSLDDRLKSFRNFAGIDRTRPLGLFSIWGDNQSADVIFLPIDDPNDIDDLLKTATFGIVGYHQVSPTHYQIDRPGSPYEVVIRERYVLLADSLAMIQGLTITPEQLTRGYRDRYEMAVVIDPTQIPSSARSKYVKALRDQAEPALQPQDDEQTETARIRRTVGNLLVTLIERSILDMSSAAIGVHLDLETRKLRTELTIQAASNTPMASLFGQWNRYRSQFMPLIANDVPASFAINAPLGGLLDEILNGGERSAAKETAPLDAGLQIVGRQLGTMTLIGAIRSEGVVSLNQAIPDLMEQLHKNKQIQNVVEDFDFIDGISLHSFTLNEAPAWLTTLVGSNAEVIVGQGKKTVWLAIGHSKKVLDDLEDAMSQIEEGAAAKADSPLAHARFQATYLPELIKSDLLIPNVDAETTKQAFAKGDDGVTLMINPITNGIRISLEAEQGFVRLIGRDWVKQIESRSKD